MSHASPPLSASANKSSSAGPSLHRLPAITPTSLRLQPKLTINTPGDKYEQEADRVAEQVMRMPEPSIQRQCACGNSASNGECEECKKKKQQPKSGTIQRKSGSALGGTTAPSIVNDVIRSSGSPLPSSTRSFMESRFGQDFGHVRVHTDQRSAESATAVQARAYTVGSNVVFGNGYYSPGSSAGLKLLAHELTHVLQQSTGNHDTGPRAKTAQAVARTPISVQRDFLPDASASLHGDGQFCVDFSSGEYYLEGNFNAQAGVSFAGDFHGIDYTKTGRLGEGQTDKLKLLPRSECNPSCDASSGSMSLPPLSIPLLPGSLNVSGDNCGVNVSAQGQVDLLPLFPALNTPIKAVTKIIDAKAEVGAMVSLNLHACKDSEGDWGLDRSLGCFGFYADLGKSASMPVPNAAVAHVAPTKGENQGEQGRSTPSSNSHAEMKSGPKAASATSAHSNKPARVASSSPPKAGKNRSDKAKQDLSKTTKKREKTADYLDTRDRNIPNPDPLADRSRMKRMEKALDIHKKDPNLSYEDKLHKVILSESGHQSNRKGEFGENRGRRIAAKLTKKRQSEIIQGGKPHEGKLVFIDGEKSDPTRYNEKGARNLDHATPDYKELFETKSAKLTLNSSTRQMIAEDRKTVSKGSKVTYILLGGASKRVLKQLKGDKKNNIPEIEVYNLDSGLPRKEFKKTNI